MNDLAQINRDLQSSTYTKEMATLVKETNIISEEDAKFLADNVDHFKSIIEKSYMWRTMGQKLSIVSDGFHPTLHSKFHQAIIEAKVQFNETFRLAVDAEKAKLDVEDVELDLEEIEQRMKDLDPTSIAFKKEDVLRRRKELELKEKAISLNNYKTAAYYRMREVKQWKEIQDDLYAKLKAEGKTDEEIWNKESAELEDQFFTFLNNLSGIPKSTSAAEVNNLVGLARYAVEQARQIGMLDDLVSRCNGQQLEALRMLGVIKIKEKDEQ